MTRRTFLLGLGAILGGSVLASLGYRSVASPRVDPPTPVPTVVDLDPALAWPLKIKASVQLVDGTRQTWAIAPERSILLPSQVPPGATIVGYEPSPQTDPDGYIALRQAQRERVAAAIPVTNVLPSP